MDRRAMLSRRIEGLRRRLYAALVGDYDPRRLEQARGISAELDRLVVELTRGEDGSPAGARGRRRFPNQASG